MNMNRDNKTPSRYKRGIRYIPVVLTILVGVMLSVVGFGVLRDWEEQAMRTDLERRAEERISVLKRDIESYLLIIESLAGLYNASHTVERQEFREFVEPFLLRFPGIQALEWIPRVLDS